MKEGDKTFLMLRSDFFREKTEKVANNYKPVNILICGLNYNEFNRVSTCVTAKEVLDILETTYEETSQV